MDADELGEFRAAHPNVVEVRELRLPRGRGLFWGYLAPLMNVVPVVHNKRLIVLVGGQLQTVVLVRFTKKVERRSTRTSQKPLKADYLMAGRDANMPASR
jgi:hypothetical protein